jgi:lipoyl(octanoyl) transferase
MRVIFKEKPDYLKSLDEMESLVQNIINGDEEEVWFLEYDDLYTVGSGDIVKSNYINNIPVFKTNRGGKITYHGCGQRIVYFMIDLKKFFYPNQPDISKFVEILEDIVISSLKEIGISSNKLDVNHGVWCGTNKISAIGIRLKKWVTYHGLSLNVNTNLDFYNYINPCGISFDEYGVTSISRESGIKHYLMSSIDSVLIRKIKEIF